MAQREMKELAVACIRLSGTMISKTPTFIGDGRRSVVQRTLEYVPGSFIRGAFGIALIKALCVKNECVYEHENCQAKDGCPYFQLFTGDHKTSNIIFRYAYPKHVGCRNRGVYLPSPNTPYNGKHFGMEASHSPGGSSDGSVSFDPLKPCREYVCSGCGHVTRNPANLMRVKTDGLTYKPEVSEKQFSVEVISPGTPFNLEIILALKAESYVDLVHHILVRALLKSGIGRWKRIGFGRFIVEPEVQRISEDDVERRAGEIDASNFSVRLLSPMILDMGLLTPSILLETARRAYSFVFHEGKPKLPDIYLEDMRIFRENHSGWSLKRNRRRGIKTAISTSSIFHFKCHNPDETLSKALAALELYAVGLYKPHGCGQVKIERFPQ